MLSRGQAALVRRMLGSAGVPVTYTRGAESVALTAWVGRTLFARQDEEPGPSVVWGERDYLIPVASLVLAGQPATPRRGDRITETVDGTALTWELQTPTGEPEWRYSDQTRTVFRVHVKRVG